MDDAGRLWFSLILIFAAGSFGWRFYRGFKTGVASVPVKPFGEDEFERGNTMFGLMQCFNVIGLVAVLAILSKIWIGW